MPHFFYTITNPFRAIVNCRYVTLIGLILNVATFCNAQNPSVSLNVSNALSCSQLSAVISATASCSGDITYSFSGPNSFSLVNTTGIASVTINGTFSVTATNVAGTCSASNTITVGSSLHPDYLPLVDFYNSTGGPNWLNNTGWLTNCDPCSGWFGIACTEGRVTELALITDNGPLGSNNLNGKLPSSIGGLNKLRTLRLHNNNNLTGPIPESFAELRDLRELSFFYSGLSGTILDKLVGLTQLETIILTYGKFTGPIPESISALTKLVLFAYPSDEVFGFTGPLPASLSALTSLRYLQLDGNRITGPLPPSLGQLTNLNTLTLARNQITGTIPNEWGNISNLRVLYLNNNQLTGNLPVSLGNLPLNQLLLNNNQLSGGIPSSFSALCGKDIHIENNPGLPSWEEFCADGINTISSVKDGNWHDPTVWSTGQVPTLINNVILHHNVVIPTSQAGQSRKIIYGTGGRA